MAELTEDQLRKLISALHFAAQRHRLQRRKDAEKSPYINHPIALLDVLANEGDISDYDILSAAVLHDVIEDCARAAEERSAMSLDIEQRFGESVLKTVREATDDKDLETAERKRLQIEHSAHLSKDAQCVKLAEKIVNLRDIAFSPPADWSLERRRDYFDWAKKVVSAMVDPPANLVNAFDRAYSVRP